MKFSQITLLIIQLLTKYYFVSSLEICPINNWLDTGIDAIDLSISSEGDLFIIATDNRIYQYDHLSNTYSLLHADNEVTQPKRISATSQGTPFVLSASGEIYYLSYYNHWIKLPGCATDISIGRNGDIWKLGCHQLHNGGYSISKLLCNNNEITFTSPIINVEREHVRFRRSWGDAETFNTFINYDVLPNEFQYKDDIIYEQCHWVDIEGEGTRIAVGVNGEPYIIAPGGIVMKYESPSWTGIYGQAALDLDISNEGVLFTVGVDGSVMRCIVEEMGTWIQLKGINAMNIAVGPYSQPIISRFMDGRVFTSTNALT
jgi:hypothetical protein